MMKARWSKREIDVLIQGRKDGIPTHTLAKELGRSKNQVNCAWNNYMNRHNAYSWEEIKEAVRRIQTK
jgi:hypothetical protein